MTELSEGQARISGIARQVYEDEALAQEFLLSPHLHLEGLKPIEFAETEAGAHRVERLLWNIYYGLPV